MADSDLGTGRDEVQFRFREDEMSDSPQVTVDAFLEQSNAAAVRIEPGDDARDLLPHLGRIRLIEINFPSLWRRTRLFRSTHPARAWIHRRSTRGGRCAGRPDRLYAPLRFR